MMGRVGSQLFGGGGWGARGFILMLFLGNDGVVQVPNILKGG